MEVIFQMAYQMLYESQCVLKKYLEKFSLCSIEPKFVNCY